MTSSLLQLIDALNRCVDPEHHTRIIWDALELAGLVDIPNDRDAFRSFVAGSLKQATSQLLGEPTSAELSYILMRMTSVRAPSSRMPKATPRYETAAYTEDAFANRPDVLLLDEQPLLYDELKSHLEVHGIKIEHREDGHGITGTSGDPPRLLITNIGLDEGLRCAEKLSSDLGPRAPGVVILTEQSDFPDPPECVERIMSASALAPIVMAIVDILAPH